MGDVRLVTALVLVLLFIGYLAVRRIPAESAVKARRSVVIALVGAVNIVIVNRSVDWWENRTLHQESTLLARKIRDETLFTLSFSFAVGMVLFAWLLLHRFRLAYLSSQIEQLEVGGFGERRAEADELGDGHDPCWISDCRLEHLSGCGSGLRRVGAVAGPVAEPTGARKPPPLDDAR